MVYFENTSLGKYGESLYWHTIRCTSSCCASIEKGIRGFLSQNSRSIRILDITQYGTGDVIYTTIWFTYLN